MLTAEGPKLIEYNVRFGDPECQVLMMRFAGDLAATLLAVAHGRLGAVPPPAFDPAPALTVVIAADGYPATPRTGGRIDGIDAAEAAGAIVFQAGTKAGAQGLETAGGRVLAVTAAGATVAEAQARAYGGVDALRVENSFCRRDIGWRAVARERERG